MGQPQPVLSFIFGLFIQTSLLFLQQKYGKKCPSIIRCWDLNLQPLEHESPPIPLHQGSRPRWHINRSYSWQTSRQYDNRLSIPVCAK